MTRVLDIRLIAARDEGFIALEDGESVAAFETPAAAARWIESRLRQVDGEKHGHVDVQTSEAYPNVFAATEVRRRGILGRLKNG